jgi:hypothetical protein
MTKTLLTSTALALFGLANAASAQSVLERVLASINPDNMMPVTGTFANVAENIAVMGGGGTTTVYYYTEDVNSPAYTEADLRAAYAIDPANVVFTYDQWKTVYYTSATQPAGPAVILNNIDGSVTNVLSGVADATASVNGTVQATEQVTVDIGNVSTTVLGAVNTGTTTLGVNSDYNRAIGKTAQAVSGKVRQLGGMADQTALVLNVASNATSVVGSVSNSFAALNGSVGNVSTTVLGAVNTGTIASGVNAVSNGIVAGITGGAL